MYILTFNGIKMKTNTTLSTLFQYSIVERGKNRYHNMHMHAHSIIGLMQTIQ